MRKLFMALLLGSITLCVAELSAKEKTAPPKLKEGTSDHTDPYVNGPESETFMVREVRHRLVSLPRFGVFDDLGFIVNGDVVTLVGQVAQPILKDDAEHAVKGVEGVAKIVNNIEVLPLSPFDDQIRRRVYLAIYGDSALSARYGFRAMPPIHIIVKNGNVRLEGVVANQMDRTIAGMRASGVPGTFAVINSLTVEKP